MKDLQKIYGSGNVVISRALLGELIGRLEARIPAPTIADRITLGQREVNETIESDRALVDECRHYLRP